MYNRIIKVIIIGFVTSLPSINYSQDYQNNDLYILGGNNIYKGINFDVFYPTNGVKYTDMSFDFFRNSLIVSVGTALFGIKYNAPPDQDRRFFIKNFSIYETILAITCSENYVYTFNTLTGLNVIKHDNSSINLDDNQFLGINYANVKDMLYHKPTNSLYLIQKDGSFNYLTVFKLSDDGLSIAGTYSRYEYRHEFYFYSTAIALGPNGNDIYIFNDTDNGKPVIYKLGLSGNTISFSTSYIYVPDLSEKFGIRVTSPWGGFFDSNGEGTGIVIEKSTRPGTISDPNPKKYVLYKYRVDEGPVHHFAEPLVEHDFVDIVNSFNGAYNPMVYIHNLSSDTDGDGVSDDIDNCIEVSNADQADFDGDGIGDSCDDDDDNDGCIDSQDPNPLSFSPDEDGDGVAADCDLCDNDPLKLDPGICGCGVPDIDQDNDGIFDCNDNCPTSYNPLQEDSDCDGVGDVCDLCEGGNDQLDTNNDGIPDCMEQGPISVFDPSWICDKNEKKVLVCHHPPDNPDTYQTLCISVSALSEHLLHGDYIGPCDDASCLNGMEYPSFEIARNTLEQPILLYPNPMKDVVNLKWNADLKTSIHLRIHDQIGRLVFEQNDLKGPINSFSPGLKNGVYLVSIKSEFGFYTQKLMVTQ